MCVNAYIMVSDNKSIKLCGYNKQLKELFAHDFKN